MVNWIKKVLGARPETDEERAARKERRREKYGVNSKNAKTQASITGSYPPN